MLHPVGDLAPSVYWRRRVLIVAALALVVVSGYALISSGGGKKPAAAPPNTSTQQSSSQPISTSISRTTPTAPTSSTSTPTAACVASQLKVSAGTDAASYPVGAKPKVALIVVNAGAAPCFTGLADQQIEIRVYAGSARVWGSHDCAIAPGSSVVTLPRNQPIRREVEWTGLSSQPGCAGVRQRAPAGTYTVFALLDGRQGTPATFRFT